MTLFLHKSSNRSWSGLVLTILVFACVLLLFSYGFSRLSESNSVQQEEQLRISIHEACVHCYAVEGYYPESLEDLMEDYSIRYDSSKYIVNYEPMGENILPQVTVIARSGGEQ